MDHLSRCSNLPEVPLRRMTAAITEILRKDSLSVYLYGSAVLDDYRPGLSDIDILVLTEKPIGKNQTEELLRLRQKLCERYTDNTYRLFEGGMLSLNAFLSGAPDTVIYWGTSGERITDRYAFDSFCTLNLLRYGVLLCGKDVRHRISPPARDAVLSDISHHCETVREFGGKTGESLYTYGWLLDISRCFYTLRTGEITSKTAAGFWALKNGLCPDKHALETALQVRRNPALFTENDAFRTYAGTLGDTITAYADALFKELKKEQRT